MRILNCACLLLISLCWMAPVHGQSSFRRADSNGDGAHDLSDIVFTLNFLFLGGVPPDCRDAADTDDSGEVDLTDAIATANWQFLAGRQPPFPLVICGIDLTPDSLGCEDHDACTLSNQPPATSFAAAPEFGPAPLHVQFDASASVDADGAIASFGWDFGDGAVGTGALASHVYDSPGAYTVKLIATDNMGSAGAAQKSITVEELPAPTLDLTEPPECPPADPSGCDGCEKSRLRSSHGVYAFSGEFYIEQDNLRIKGRGLDFVWALKYRSRIGPKTAQGNGWDFSYNIRIEPMGTDIVLHDGNTRVDRYEFLDDGTPNGLWAALGFFRELRKEADGSYILRFAGGGAWHFHALDGSPRGGKLRAIADRNANTVNFGYDPAGRLVTVNDTLDRLVVIAYYPEGFIASVTDFAGRKVQYAYYQDGDAGGSAGDLKSVTSPAVTGTPTGNDFPNGKTTVFTYTKGFAEEELNHNLLAITNPMGEALCNNEYARVIDPKVDPLFDRITRQFLGNHQAPRDWVYVEETSNQENNHAVIRVIENDRMGNVTESFFDVFNRAVIRREFTGRAQAGLPTTLTENRPSGRLRAGDPEYFETRYRYNEDSLITETGLPNGNVIQKVHELELNPNAPWLSRGNLRELRRLPGSHKPAGDQALITELFEYDAGFGSCCGSSFVARHTDARGNVTIHQYDEHGNRLRTQHRIPAVIEDFEYNAFGQIISHTHPDNGSGHRRRDEFTYYKSGPQTGYIEQDNIAAGGLSLTTRYEHDLVGNVIRKIDARGHDTLFAYNQLDHLVRETSREVFDGSGVRYQKDYFGDLNGNLVRIDVQNIDDQGVLQANTHFTTLYAYDISNQLIRKTEEVVEGRNVVTEFEYDANQNLVLTQFGQATGGDQNPATAGPQPQNTLTTLYDERNLLFRRIRAAGHADQSTTQYDYDGNGNLAVTTELEELLPRTHRRTYDGFDRLVRATDPMGNERLYEYDPSGNRTRERVMGEAIDVAGGTANFPIEEVSFTFDAMGRNEIRESAFRDSSGTPIGDGKSTTRYRWSDNSQILSVFDDNGHETVFAYDTANRRKIAIDPEGNTIVEDWDRNSNRITIQRIEKSQLGSPDETFTDRFVYDNLDRPILTTDSAGNTADYRYDSRGNLTTRLDALRLKPTDPGNVTRYVYDGLSRLLQVRRAVTSDGTGSGTPAGEVFAPRNTWDDSSRLTRVEDPRGSATSYAYDPLNRRISTTQADGSIIACDYDVHENLIEFRDPNGNLVRQDFDLLNRLVRREIEPGPGVSIDTTLELYAYDGRSRLIRGEDDDSVVTRSYDSLSNLLRETQNGQTIDFTRDGEGNVLSMEYPGGRTITYGYDALDRPAVITEPEELVGRNHYFGPGRLEARDLANNTRALFEHDKARRVVGVRHVFDPSKNAAVIDHRTFTYDKAHQKTSRTDMLQGTETDYQYDSLHRLIGSSRTAGQATLAIDYQLDGVGNRMRVTGGPDAGQYTMNAQLPEPGDLAMNQYTTTPSDGRLYDANGNLIQLGQNAAQCINNYRNQLVSFTNPTTGQVTTYAYDVFGRRIQKKIQLGAKFSTVRYFYDGWQLIEEQDLSFQTIATYVCPSDPSGLFDGTLLSMRRGANDYYYHQDDLGNVVAVTDGLGKVVERYDYQDFGAPVILDPAGNAIAGTAIGNHILFAGALYDVESGFYLMGKRYYDPRAGRFTTRDPRGLWGDAENLGNPLTFAGNSPWSMGEPSPGGIPPGPGGDANNCGPNCHWDGQRCICLDESTGEGDLGAGSLFGKGMDEFWQSAIEKDIELFRMVPQLGKRRLPSVALMRATAMGSGGNRGSRQGALSGQVASGGRSFPLANRGLLTASDLRLRDEEPPGRGTTIGGALNEIPVDAMDPSRVFDIEVLGTDESIEFEEVCELRCEYRPGSQYLHCKVWCVVNP